MLFTRRNASRYVCLDWNLKTTAYRNYTYKSTNHLQRSEKKKNNAEKMHKKKCALENNMDLSGMNVKGSRQQNARAVGKLPIEGSGGLYGRMVMVKTPDIARTASVLI